MWKWRKDRNELPSGLVIVIFFVSVLNGCTLSSVKTGDIHSGQDTIIDSTVAGNHEGVPFEQHLAILEAKEKELKRRLDQQALSETQAQQLRDELKGVERRRETEAAKHHADIKKLNERLDDLEGQADDQLLHQARAELDQGSVLTTQQMLIIQESVERLCKKPKDSGEYWEINTKGNGDVGVKLKKFFQFGLSGEVSFSKVEWAGIRSSVENEKDYRKCALTITPAFLRAFIPLASVQLE